MKEDLRRSLKVLAINVRDLRKKRGLSQEALAEITGLHRTYVGAVERAERNVTIATVCAFARALDATLADLLTSRRS